MTYHLDEAFNGQAYRRNAHRIAKAAIGGMLAISFLSGVVSMHFAKRHLQQPAAWIVLSFLLILTLTYVWYYDGSIEHSFPRSRAINTGVILLAIVVVPYYLATSRVQGHRFKAMLGLLGFACCYVLFAVLGVLVVHLVPIL